MPANKRPETVTTPHASTSIDSLPRSSSAASMDADPSQAEQKCYVHHALNQITQLVADQLVRWKLTKGKVKHASGLNNSCLDTERWLAPNQPHLQHLAAASSAGTSLEANLKHITLTLATWNAVWEVYLDPKWGRQRLRLYRAQDRTLEQFFKKVRSEEAMAEVSAKCHGRAKELVVFFSAASIGTV
ncbi:uncharacterized protein HaLaN_19438, partial [Haematococcus lacustris]